MKSIRFVPIWLILLTSNILIASEQSGQVSTESLLFQKYKDGIVTVICDEGKGSGFLIDTKGLILTNYHIVSNSGRYRVQINDSVKVKAKLVAFNKRKDVAVIWIHEDYASNLPLLPIDESSPTSLREGQHVIALGNPLRQTKIITSGIISKVEPGAIFSDVNINPGSSGGPLLDVNGKVIAINTFGDFSSVGPGISGSIPISFAKGTIAEAIEKIKNIPMPSKQLLPIPSNEPYPMWGYKKAMSNLPGFSSTKRVSSYGGSLERPGYLVKTLYNLKNKGYYLTFITPPYAFKIKHFYKTQIAYEKNKSSNKNYIGNFNYDPIDNIFDWQRYIQTNTNTVILDITPNLEKYNYPSIGDNYVTAYNVNKLSYDAPERNQLRNALLDCKLYVNNIPQEEIERHFGYTSYYTLVTYDGFHKDQYISRKGTFIYSVDLFAPTENAWPEIMVEIKSLDNPQKPIQFKIPQATIEQIWYDFEPIRRQRELNNEISN